MLRRMLCALGLVLLVCPGCGDGGAAVSQRQFALLGELHDTLTKVTDAATLKTELPKLEELSKQLAATQAEFNKQQVSTEQARDLRARYGKDLESLEKDLAVQSQRIDTLSEVDEKDRDQLVAVITAASTGITP